MICCVIQLRRFNDVMISRFEEDNEDGERKATRVDGDNKKSNGRTEMMISYYLVIAKVQYKLIKII